MYGPRGRAIAMIYITGVTAVFIGALALPLLIQEDVIAPRFGSGDGFRLQGGPSEAVPNGVGILDLPGPPRTPGAVVSSPALSTQATFTVGWEEAGPSVQLYYVYHVQYAAISEEGSGEWSWEDWFASHRADLPREAAFTGIAGETYAFRGRTCMMLQVDCSDWSATTTTQVDTAAAPAEVWLEITPRFPSEGSILDGYAAIAWDYHHDGPGTGMVEVGLRSHATGTWSPLYSGTGLSMSWDTARHEDGRYELHLMVRDGVFSEQVLIDVQIGNHVIETEGGTAHVEEDDPGVGAGSDAHPEEGPALAIGHFVFAAAAVLQAVRLRRR